jgi:NADPH:quinone reductase-like Zn-dependent oxidoreductase
MSNSKMKAVICPVYGPPDVLRVENVPKPVPKNNEILVQIIASAVNTADVRVRGLAVEGFLKIIMRFVLGFSKPRNPVLGTVFSGIVVQVGEKVSNFAVGDEVYGLTGFKFGAHAEFITLRADAIVTTKPVNAIHVEAAAILFGGQTAIYFLEKAKISQITNPRILVYGATGSVGTAAIQIAKHYKANVTAVCSENGSPLARELGADNVILYDKEDFTNSDIKYDIVFDAVGKTTKKQCIHLLKPGGLYKTVGGLETASENVNQLKLLRELFESGFYKPTIDRVYTMEQIVEAHRYVDTGRKKGNVVLKIAD